MNLLLWLFVCYFLAVIGLTVNDFVDGHRGVKFNLSFQASFKSNEVCWSGGAVHSRYIRKVSRKYEALGTGFDFSGEDFQNMGTFIVVRSTVFVKSSGQKTHLARDAYSAFWD